jgi:chemotaxis regulatin CheY-phosphate phosphatase CheZ
MKSLFELLNDKERRIAAVCGAALAVALCVLLAAAVKARVSAGRAADELRAAEASYQVLDRERNAVRSDWQAWVNARKDLASLKESRFYEAAKGLQDMRLDLQRIFDAAGLVATDVAYGYTDLVKGVVQKVTADFRFTANYAGLKRLLDAVERHPRFLHAERIDFLSMTKQPGVLDLRVSFAGYYEY